jgi:hypothetical protein
MRRDGVWNEAERRPARRISLDAGHFGFEPLQPLEIPQNRQRFIWKSLEKNGSVLEKLAEKLGSPPLFRHLYPAS